MAPGMGVCKVASLVVIYLDGNFTFSCFHQDAWQSLSLVVEDCCFPQDSMKVCLIHFSCTPIKIHRILSAVTVVLRALAYDVLKGTCSIGSHVRDAACYVFWFAK